MKELDLLQAVGHIQERYLTEAEASTDTATANRRLWRIALAAAIICLLTVSAIAAPSVISALRGADVHYRTDAVPYVSIYGHDTGVMVMPGSYDVLLNIQVDPQAPSTLEMPQLPQVLLDEYPEIAHCARGETGVQYFCDRGRIRFEQYAIPEGGNGTYRAICRGLRMCKVEEQMIKCGDIDVLEVVFRKVTEQTEGSPIRQLYWSDGMYIYYLLVPYEMDAADYERIIASVRPVPDLTPYLTQRESPHIWGTCEATEPEG